MTTIPALQEILRGLFEGKRDGPKMTKTGKDQRKSPETTKQVIKWH